jgi:DUF1680 family protein
LYNGLISGVGLDGKSFFYTNAMEIKHNFAHNDMEGERSGWFTCSCCPTNVTRLIPSIPGYVYAQKGNDLYVNLFVSSNTTVTLNKKKIQIEQKNNYPWDGNLKFMISPASTTNFNLLVRLPGWSQDKAIPSDLYSFASKSQKKISIKVNGKVIDYKESKGYAVISRTWKKADVVEIELPMDVRRVVANTLVEDDIGRVALQSGPIVYCAEWTDNFGKTSNLILPKDATFSKQFNDTLLNGVMQLKSEALAVNVSSNNTISTVQQAFVAIPYYAWAHRGKGEMVVWIPEQVKTVDLISR